MESLVRDCNPTPSEHNYEQYIPSSMKTYDLSLSVQFIHVPLCS